MVCFYPVGHRYQTAFEKIGKLEDVAGFRLNLGLVSLAYVPTEIADLFLGISSNNRGGLYSDCAVKPELSLGGSVRQVSHGLAQFLGALKPQWATTRQSQYDI
jgi:hypothetical protein